MHLGLFEMNDPSLDRNSRTWSSHRRLETTSVDQCNSHQIRDVCRMATTLNLASGTSDAALPF